MFSKTTIRKYKEDGIEESVVDRCNVCEHIVDFPVQTVHALEHIYGLLVDIRQYKEMEYIDNQRKPL